MDGKCSGCKQIFHGKKISIFARDSIIKKCLVYKIHQLTGVDYLYFGNNTLICSGCHDLLVQIHLLEERFVNNFNSDDEEGGKGQSFENERNDNQNLQTTENFKERTEIHENKVEEELSNEDENFIKDWLNETEGIKKREIFNPEALKESNNFIRTNFDEVEPPLNETKNQENFSAEKFEKEQILDGIELLEENPFNKLHSNYKVPLDFENGKNQCRICGITFARRQGLIHHARRHRGDRPEKCQNCDKSFTSKGELNRHIKEHHQGTKYQCQTCYKELLNQKSVKNHEIMHSRSGGKPFQCTACAKTFSFEKLLKLHELRIHFNNGSFMCEKCPKGFSLKESLKKHMETVHKGVKPLRKVKPTKLKRAYRRKNENKELKI